MNWSQQRHLQPLLMFNYTLVNLIKVYWSHWSTTTCWLACCDMCLTFFQLESIIYCILTSVRAQLSQLGFWSVVNWSVDYGLHSVKLDSLIQFEWPPCEFELLCHSCLQHDHVFYCSFFVWIYRVATRFVALFHLCLVPRLLWQINMVSELMVEQSSDLSKTSFLTDLSWKLSNSSKIQHCTRSQGLPLNTPSK